MSDEVIEKIKSDLSLLRDFATVSLPLGGSKQVRQWVGMALDTTDKLDSGVLKEIWDFHSGLANIECLVPDVPNNARTAFGRPDSEELRVLTLVSLSKSLIKHLGEDKIDPMKMPWQYRK